MDISKLQGYDLIALANSIVILIGQQNLSSDELGMLSGFFSTIGDSLAILSSKPSSSNDSTIN